MITRQVRLALHGIPFGVGRIWRLPASRPTRRWSQHWSVTATAVLLIVSSAVGLAVTISTSISGATTVTTGSISGTITQASDGSAATHVCAEIYQASYIYSPVGGSCTDSAGHYSVGNIAAGQYLVQFIDGDTTRHDAPQWYNNQPDANTGNFVVVQAGNTTSNINAAMSAGGWITGTITNSKTSNPIANECVGIYNANTFTQAGGVGQGSFVNNNICTDSLGHYTTGGLAAGNYQVFFNPYAQDHNYVSEWYNNQPTEATANSITITQGSAIANAALNPGTPVSGNVSDAHGPVSGVSVVFYNSGNYITQSFTGIDGVYTVSVPPGAYQVQFTPSGSSTDQSQWYNNKVSQSTADSVTVGSTPVAGINALLTSGGTITGKVTTSAGVGIQSILVTACPSLTGNCPTAYTGADGSYSLSGLPTDSYTVYFGGAYPVNNAAYVQQIYPNTIEGTGSGTPVSVTVGTTTAGINDTLVLGSTLSGTVTDAETGTPLSNICVSAVPLTNSYTAGYACTDSSGKYTTPGIPSGDYNLDFTNFAGRYIEQWYNAQPSQSTANLVHVTQPTNQSGLNAAMQLGGNVSGTITASDGTTPLPGVCVELFSVGSQNGLSGGCSDGTGRYSSPAVPAGSYDVEFVDNSGIYGIQFYNGASTLAGATPVQVVQGQTSTNINASLKTVPGQPTNVVATASDQAATVTFNPPASDGGLPVSGYTITPSPACGGCTGLTTSSTSATVLGLTNGVSYSFTVSATNTNGTGLASAPSNSVTPNSTITQFAITTSSLPDATRGVSYGPVTLQEGGAGASVSPYVTAFKWKKITLPKGLKLSSAGVLSGIPNNKLVAGPSSVTVQVTETVTTINGKKKVKTKTMVQATIPLAIT